MNSSPANLFVLRGGSPIESQLKFPLHKYLREIGISAKEIGISSSDSHKSLRGICKSARKIGISLEGIPISLFPSPMKIAYLLDTYPSTTETFIAREIEALRRRGFSIEIHAFHAGEGALPTPQSLAHKLSPRRWDLVGRALDLRGFDHVHAGWANHLADVARAAAHRANLPWSFSAHARDLWVEGGDLRGKLASAKFATTCTLAGAEELRRFGSNVVYAPHGLELSRYEFRLADLGKDGQDKRLVGVGRLVEKKGWMDALTAANDTNAELTVFGDGPLHAHLKHKFAVWGGHTLRPTLPHDQLIQQLRAFNCLVLPSRRTNDGDRDGLANVLLEAGALGLPIVTTDAGSASDFVDNSTGYLCESGDLLALAEAIRRVFSEPEATIERCFHARKRVEERFDADRNIGVLAGLFAG